MGDAADSFFDLEGGVSELLEDSGELSVVHLLLNDDIANGIELFNTLHHQLNWLDPLLPKLWIISSLARLLLKD